MSQLLVSAFIQSECIRARELRSWVDLLPNAHITLLIDTHQSTIAWYGMRRAPKVAEIMDDPWGELIGPHSTSVVYYLKPDPTAAIARQMGITQERKEEGKELGMLTECFVSALQIYLLGLTVVTLCLMNLRIGLLKNTSHHDLSIILSLIQARAIVPSEDYDKVADTKHHGSIERTGERR